MGAESEKAANIAGPIVTANDVGVLTADPTGLSGTMRYAVSAVSTPVTLPPATGNPQKKSTLGKRFLRVLATGCNVQLSQGEGSAPALAFNQLAAFGTGHIASGGSFLNGVPDHFEIDERSTHIAFVGDAAGLVEFYLSDGSGRP